MLNEHGIQEVPYLATIDMLLLVVVVLQKILIREFVSTYITKNKNNKICTIYLLYIYYAVQRQLMILTCMIN
jgi:hypothetical protein